MSDRTIILTDWQLRALQEGRLKQIRVPVTVPWKGRKRVPPYEPYYVEEDGRLFYQDAYGDYRPMEEICPFQPGDILYVKETYSLNHSNHVSHTGILYQADALTIRSHHMPWAYFENGEWLDFYRRPMKGTCRRWRSPATMPREAARLHLTVGEVRVQRLGEMTEEDAKATGVLPHGDNAKPHIKTFYSLWQRMYAKRGYGWDNNPWTFVATVKS